MLKQIVAWRLLSCFLACVALAGCTSPRPSVRLSTPTLLLPLAVEHDVRRAVHLRPGESFTLRPYLLNVGEDTLTIAYGSRSFVLAAREHVEPTDPRLREAPPSPSTWGELARREFPNPNAAYPLPLYKQRLAPGEKHYEEGGFEVSFDRPGKYLIDLYADVSAGLAPPYSARDVRIEGRGLNVVVEPVVVELTAQPESIMRAALEHLIASNDFLSSSASVKFDPIGITGRVYDRITPEGELVPLGPAPEEMQHLAEHLATGLGIEIASFEEAVRCVPAPPASSEPEPKCWFEDESTKAFVAASIPTVRSSGEQRPGEQGSGSQRLKAHLTVYTWQASANRQMAMSTVMTMGASSTKLRLSREASGRWRVTEGVTTVN